MDDNAENWAPEPLGDDATEEERQEHLRCYLDAFTNGMRFQLSRPFPCGDGKVDVLVMQPKAGHFKGVKVHVNADGSMEYEPYAMAALCLVMAGHARSMTDRLSVQDMNALAQIGMIFFGLSRRDGKKPSR